MSAATHLTEAGALPVHTISVFVNNKPGVLVRVALVFSRRGFNIESLVVSPAAEGRFSRMTITCSGDSRPTSPRWSSSSTKLVDVVTAIDHTADQAYEVEIALIKLECRPRPAQPDPADRRALQGAGGRLRAGVADPASPRLEREARRADLPAAALQARGAGAFGQAPDGPRQARHLSRATPPERDLGEATRPAAPRGGRSRKCRRRWGP